ncbi:hypothetical protein ACFWAT_00745 [Streptomyces syringium]|uniref:hypothetical protein n=1 Tax=Streptomyces syringium TaxID=76729 RepID=UPI003652E0CB
MLLILNANDYMFDYQLSKDLGLVLACVQSVALVVAMYRPVPAWWATTLATFVAAQSRVSPEGRLRRRIRPARRRRCPGGRR